VLEDPKDDSTSLYLKDIKTFLGIRKAAVQYNKKKRDTYVAQGDPEIQVVREAKGVTNSKVAYHSQVLTNPVSEVDKQLNSRLCGVIQSLNTDGFFQVSKTGEKETVGMLRKRINNSITNAMDEIDKAEEVMDNNERQERFKRKEKLGDIFKNMEAFGNPT
jgi:hypothetical protein